MVLCHLCVIKLKGGVNKCHVNVIIVWLKVPQQLLQLGSVTCLSLAQGGCVVSEGMDPLGARSQFVDIQTLPTWPQQLDEDSEAGPPEQSLIQDYPSPFPFRPDVNSKIILL